MIDQSPLSKKMGIKPEDRIHLIGAPAAFAAQLGPLPPQASIAESGSAGVVVLFCTRKADLDSGLGPALDHLADGGHIWVAFPKGKPKEPRDLTRDRGWEALEGQGLDGVNLISLDEEWSAFKFRRTGKPQPSGDQLLAEQYSGSRAPARPLFERVIAECRRLGPDVEESVRKTYVALSRRSQFALLSPGAGGRLDVGLKLKGVPASGRLQESPEFGSGSITHKVTLRSVQDVDQEFLSWLRAAYESTAPK